MSLKLYKNAGQLYRREAKEIGGVCTQAGRITIRILQMYSYIIDNFRMGLTFIVSFG